MGPLESEQPQKSSMSAAYTLICPMFHEDLRWESVLYSKILQVGHQVEASALMMRPLLQRLVGSAPDLEAAIKG